jgi:hypothetical protein
MISLIAIIDRDGNTLIAYLAWDGQKDRLILAKESNAGIRKVGKEVASGVLHAPALASEKTSAKVWVFWGTTSKDTTVNIMARSWDPEKGLGKVITIADSKAAEAFLDAGTDAKGRVWVTWQSFRAGEGDIYARYLNPDSGKWSKEIPVSTHTGGDWEPRIAFDPKGNAWIIYDSSRGNEFNLYLAKVEANGEVTEYPIGHTSKYEARASIAATVAGDGFWITAEQGKEKHGLDYRGHENDTGINARKRVLFGKFDLATKQFTRIPLGPAGEAGLPVNRPMVGVGKGGDPWVAYRYFNSALWRIAVTCYRQESKAWSSRRRLPSSSYGQDRSVSFIHPTGKGDIRICWPSDERPHKAHQTAKIMLATLPSAKSLPDALPPKLSSSTKPNDLPHSHKTP